MKEGDRVRLRSFNGSSQPPPDVQDGENHWLLIGRLGTVRPDPTEPDFYRRQSGLRLCVQFDDDISALGLACHNSVKNSLWMRETDLEAAG